MIRIEKLKCNTQLSQLINIIKNDMLEFNFPITADYQHRFYKTEDAITLVFSALDMPIIRLEYNLNLKFAYIYKHMYYITRDAHILHEFEQIISKLLTQCAD
jgi:hypothetical protein